jgi:hypothetical protein
LLKWPSTWRDAAHEAQTRAFALHRVDVVLAPAAEADNRCVDHRALRLPAEFLPAAAPPLDPGNLLLFIERRAGIDQCGLTPAALMIFA